MDIEARRNAFGRQVRSFEADLDIPGIDGPPGARGVHPGALDRGGTGTGVEILAEVDGHAVAARQGITLVVAFHPELSGERACTRGSSTTFGCARGLAGDAGGRARR